MRMIAEEFGASIHAVEDKVNAMAKHIGADISRRTPFALRRRMNEWIESPPNFERLVLGCIETNFFKQIVNTRWKGLDEIYKIYMLLHRSDLNIPENFRQTFSQFSAKIKIRY